MSHIHLLSIHYALWTGRLAEVCKLPLTRSGRISAPWSPSSCTRILRPSKLLVTETSFDHDVVLALSAFASRYEHFSLTAPSPRRRPHNTTLFALKSTLSDCVLGMHATPDRFRLDQNLLVAKPGSRFQATLLSVFFSSATSPLHHTSRCDSLTSRFSSRFRRATGPTTILFVSSRTAHSGLSATPASMVWSRTSQATTFSHGTPIPNR